MYEIEAWKQYLSIYIYKHKTMYNFLFFPNSLVV